MNGVLSEKICNAIMTLIGRVYKNYLPLNNYQPFTPEAIPAKPNARVTDEKSINIWYPAKTYSSYQFDFITSFQNRGGR